MGQRKGRRAVLALTGAALALPGYARAGTPPAQLDLDSRLFFYRESKAPAARTSNSERRRYEIDGYALRVAAPLGADFGLEADLLVETMSGASPWFITPGENGEPIQVLSGATIDDERSDLLVRVTRYGQGVDFSGSLGVSDENDYRAINAALEAAITPDGGPLSYNLGLGYSDDELRPTEGASQRFPDRIAAADKSSVTVSGSLSLILNRHAVIQLGGSLARHQGYLSDPYKMVFVENSTRNDARPDQRHIGVLSARYRHYLDRPGAALHADYRLTVDDWDIESHTVEASWHQNLGRAWTLIPGLRFYSQSQAEFYGPYFETAPGNGLASSDYRLSPYGAVSLRLQAQRHWPRARLSLGWERYEADGSLALGSVQLENPGLVSYDLISLGFSYRFD